ncbi:sporulation membrane protein YtaF [Alkalicoccobacillus porphyridii]|uniref:Sporulation membrane protein YtaF n=1 Tax=Alkalicoccobacillus porphyridii TaxID=2597270 RepID=A0A554A2W1_9BACI|nr:sporulation membrane protein YtaF [Alkalicoccobacillus porphyridii]TSB48027.1 sporulation membrane protein YtaF [Alkalicoccobacillus porphyridii]
MAGLLTLLVLAFALSLDSYGVGVTYGLRKVKIPFLSLMLIACCSGVSILVAMLVGKTIFTYLPVEWAEATGAFLLIFIGLFTLWQVYAPAKKTPKPVRKRKENQFNFQLRIFGFVIHVLREPLKADIDDSGSITGREAVLLGAALSLDAFGAGVGAALLGYAPWLLSVCVALMSGLFLMLGMKSGFRFSHIPWVNRLSFLPGVILIMLGIWRF